MVSPNGFNSVTPILGHASDSLEELVKNKRCPAHSPLSGWRFSRLRMEEGISFFYRKLLRWSYTLSHSRLCEPLLSMLVWRHTGLICWQSIWALTWPLKPGSRTGSISGESLLLIQPLPGLITGLSFLEELPCPEGGYSFPQPGCFPRLWTFQDIWKISRACRSFQHAGGCECSLRRLASGVREGILLVQCVCVCMCSWHSVQTHVMFGLGVLKIDYSQAPWF